MPTQGRGNPYPSPVPLRTHAPKTPYPPPDALSDDPEADESYYTTRPGSSAIRYTDTQGNQVFQRGNKRMVIHHQPPPRNRPQVSLYIGLGMMVMGLLLLGMFSAASWWSNYQLDARYGNPRTYQTDALVYPDDTTTHPSHYIFLNLNGTATVIELRHGDTSHARIYKIAALFNDNAASIPITGEFKEVNGKEEMIIHIQDQVIVYVNDGTQFKPQ